MKVLEPDGSPLPKFGNQRRPREPSHRSSGDTSKPFATEEEANEAASTMVRAWIDTIHDLFNDGTMKNNLKLKVRLPLPRKPSGPFRKPSRKMFRGVVKKEGEASVNYSLGTAETCPGSHGIGPG